MATTETARPRGKDSPRPQSAARIAGVVVTTGRHHHRPPPLDSQAAGRPRHSPDSGHARGTKGVEVMWTAKPRRWCHSLLAYACITPSRSCRSGSSRTPAACCASAGRGTISRSIRSVKTTRTSASVYPPAGSSLRRRPRLFEVRHADGVGSVAVLTGLTHGLCTC